MKIINDIRITKAGLGALNFLLNHSMVNNYHKALLKGIKSNMPKNVSKSDCEMFDLLYTQYKSIGICGVA